MGTYKFTEGLLVAGLNDAAQSLAEELDLGVQQRATVSTALVGGFMLGTLCLGSYGDRFGRRPTVLASLFASSVLVLLLSFAENFPALLAYTMLAGTAVGMGLPSSYALVSEMTPTRWRIAAQVLTMMVFTLGQVTVTLVFAFDDPSLRHLRWRKDLRVIAVLFAAAAALAGFGLRESAAFLAAAGRHAEAAETLAWVRRLNGGASVDVSYDAGTPLADGAAAASRQSLLDELSVVFSPELLPTTVSLSSMLLCSQLVRYGFMYASPLVLHQASTMVATDQLLQNLLWGVVCCVLVGSAAHFLSRRSSASLALLLAALCVSSFAWAGSAPKPRGWIMQGLFELASACTEPSVQLAMIVGNQMTVDAYPVSAASTSASLIQGSARFGAVVSAQLFEGLTRATGEWTYFFYLLAGLNLCAAGLCAAKLQPAGGAPSTLRKKVPAAYGAVGATC